MRAPAASEKKPVRQRAKTPSFGIPQPLGSAPRTGLDGGAITLNTIEAEATLENCRALINQIIAGLSAEEPFIDFLSATGVLLYLEFACSALRTPRTALPSRALN